MTILKKMPSLAEKLERIMEQASKPVEKTEKPHPALEEAVKLTLKECLPPHTCKDLSSTFAKNLLLFQNLGMAAHVLGYAAGKALNQAVIPEHSSFNPFFDKTDWANPPWFETSPVMGIKMFAGWDAYEKAVGKREVDPSARDAVIRGLDSLPSAYLLFNPFFEIIPQEGCDSSKPPLAP